MGNETESTDVTNNESQDTSSNTIAGSQDSNSTNQSASSATGETAASGKTENVDANQQASTTSTTAKTALTPDEYQARFIKAVEKHGSPKTKEEATALLSFIGRQIHNGLSHPLRRTAETIRLVYAIASGECRDEDVLKAIEEMPVGGYGY